MKLHLPRVELGEVQDVVDEAEQVRLRRLHARERLALRVALAFFRDTQRTLFGGVVRYEQRIRQRVTLRLEARELGGGRVDARRRHVCRARRVEIVAARRDDDDIGIGGGDRVPAQTLGVAAGVR